MKARRILPLLIGVMLLPALRAAESDATKTPATDATAAKPATPDAAAATAPAAAPTSETEIRQRAVSSEVAASLADMLPSLQDATPAATPKEDEDTTDVTATSGDDNTDEDTVRLPRVTVRGTRPPIFRERDLYTQQDLSRIALRRYSGLNLTPFSWFNALNAPIALQMYEEDQRLQNMKELNDTADAFARAGDKETSEYIRNTSNATYLRSPEWGFDSSRK